MENLPDVYNMCYASGKNVLYSSFSWYGEPLTLDLPGVVKVFVFFLFFLNFVSFGIRASLLSIACFRRLTS